MSLSKPVVGFDKLIRRLGFAPDSGNHIEASQGFLNRDETQPSGLVRFAPGNEQMVVDEGGFRSILIRSLQPGSGENRRCREHGA
jgi:hypothetical protein